MMMFTNVWLRLVLQKMDVASDQFPGQLKTKYRLIHSEMCLVVDEVGSNILQ